MAIAETVQRQIIDLYVNKRLSMLQIARKLDVTQSAVNYYLEKHHIARRTISEAVTNVYITQFGKKPFVLNTDRGYRTTQLKIAGSMLYWGEGAKTGNVVQFSNSQPDMIQVFMAFLRQVCGVDESRIRAIIHMYEDHDRKELKEFWSSVSGIARHHFYPPHVHRGKRGTYKNKSRYGTMVIKYADTRLLKTILNWIDDYQKDVLIGMQAGVAQR